MNLVQSITELVMASGKDTPEAVVESLGAWVCGEKTVGLSCRWRERHYSIPMEITIK